MNTATQTTTRMTLHVPVMLSGLLIFSAGYVSATPWLAFMGVAFFVSGRMIACPEDSDPTAGHEVPPLADPSLDPACDNRAPHASTNTAPSMRLRPIVPLHSGDDVANWLGGRPFLPLDIDWPTLDDRPALFLGQFSLAHLPSDIWQGKGPRDGWLVVFVSQINLSRVKLVHTACFGTERTPPGPLTYPGTPPMREDIMTRATGHPATLPRWPVEFRRPEPDDPGQHERHSKLANRAHLAPGSRSHPGPSDPGLAPFDWDTAMILFAVIQSNLDWQRTVIARLADSDWTDPGAQSFLAALDATLEHVDALKSELSRARDSGMGFDGQLGALMMRGLASLQTDSGTLPRDADPLSLLEQDQIRSDYLHWLDLYARNLYCTTPDALPPAPRAHFEAEWAWHALHERGWVGGDLAPHFPSARDTGAHPPISLLRLQSSDLMGWVFGDQDEFCVLIDPDALSRGDFSAAYGEVSS